MYRVDVSTKAAEEQMKIATGVALTMASVSSSFHFGQDLTKSLVYSILFLNLRRLCS